MRSTAAEGERKERVREKEKKSERVVCSEHWLVIHASLCLVCTNARTGHVGFQVSKWIAASLYSLVWELLCRKERTKRETETVQSVSMLYVYRLLCAVSFDSCRTQPTVLVLLSREPVRQRG